MCLFKLFRRRKKKEAEVVPVDTVEPVKEEPVTVVKPVEVKKEPQKTEVKPKAESAKVKEVIRTDNGNVLVKVRYNRSYTAKIIQSEDKLKNYYSEIRNELLRYKIKTRTSWRYETFKTGRKLLARLAVRGKTLGLYLALNPAAYADTKYKVEDVSSVAKNAEVPLLYKIKNDRRCKYSKDLIATVMAANGLEAGEPAKDDFAAIYPYEEIEPLIGRGLVKLLKWKTKGEGAEEGLIELSEQQYEQLTATEGYTEVAAVEEEEETVENVGISVAEAEEQIDDEEAEAFVKESERYSDKTKKDIVNIDTLSKYFKDGENVTVEEIRKRVPSVHNKTTYIKVLARGTLNKALNVEADDFSPAAIKMIVLTGGTVSRTKSK